MGCIINWLRVETAWLGLGATVTFLSPWRLVEFVYLYVYLSLVVYKVDFLSWLFFHRNHHKLVCIWLRWVCFYPSSWPAPSTNVCISSVFDTLGFACLFFLGSSVNQSLSHLCNGLLLSHLSYPPPQGSSVLDRTTDSSLPDRYKPFQSQFFGAFVSYILIFLCLTHFSLFVLFFSQYIQSSCIDEAKFLIIVFEIRPPTVIVNNVVVYINYLCCLLLLLIVCFIQFNSQLAVAF